MSDIKATVAFDAAKGTATVTLNLIGTTEMEHELLATYFTNRPLQLVQFHEGDLLEARFVIEDSAAFAKAQRNVMNRIRVRNNQPMIEQEEASIAARKAADELAAKADADAKAAGFASAAEQREAEAEEARLDKLTERIADKIAAKKPAEIKVDPKASVQ